jgi:type IV secretory pathway TraG/TraD family ATPase VirD4
VYDCHNSLQPSIPTPALHHIRDGRHLQHLTLLTPEQKIIILKPPRCQKLTYYRDRRCIQCHLPIAIHIRPLHIQHIAHVQPKHLNHPQRQQTIGSIGHMNAQSNKHSSQSDRPAFA